MKVFGGFLLFLAGAAVGGFAAWKLTKDKYSDVIEIIEYNPSDHKDESEEPIEEKKTAVITKDKPSIMDYYNHRKIVQENHYDTMSKSEEPPKDPIYSISPDEFGTIPDYSTSELYLFSDDVLTDFRFDILGKDEVLKMVGEDFVSSIGEYEDEVGYIRNDTLKNDYQILTDHRKYADAIREM